MMRIARLPLYAILLAVLVLKPARAADVHQMELACRHQLRIIHEALAYYVEANDRLPDELGDLVGDYIQPGVLHCPATMASGETSSDDQGLIAPSKVDGRVWGYKYEFSKNGDFNTQDSSGRLFNWLTFKRMQLTSLVGDSVPVVRCDKHGDALKIEGHTHLNLTSSGKVYSSPTYWERMQIDKIGREYLTPDLIEYAQNPLVEYMVNRSQQATPQMVDLRSYYNAMLEHPWIYGYWGAEMDQFVSKYPDRMVWNGKIGFDAAGVIQLCGLLSQDKQNGYSYRAYPKSKRGIEVNARFATLHVLGGVLFATDPREEVAYMDLVDQDGEVMDSIAWVYGTDVVSIYADQGNPPLVSPNYSVVWRETLAYRKQPTQAVLLHMRFSNPLPDAQISRIHFRAGENVACPFIVGLTWSP